MRHEPSVHDPPNETSRGGPGDEAGIAIQAVRLAYGDVLALEQVDLSIRPHERLGIVGPSGCGKSTLLSAIAGLIEPTAGTISVGGVTGARERLARCALMPQKDLLLPWRTALDNGGARPREPRRVARRGA